MKPLSNKIDICDDKFHHCYLCPVYLFCTIAKFLIYNFGFYVNRREFRPQSYIRLYSPYKIEWEIEK